MFILETKKKRIQWDMGWKLYPIGIPIYMQISQKNAWFQISYQSLQKKIRNQICGEYVCWLWGTYKQNFCFTWIFLLIKKKCFLLTNKLFSSAVSKIWFYFVPFIYGDTNSKGQVWFKDCFINKINWLFVKAMGLHCCVLPTE